MKTNDPLARNLRAQTEQRVREVAERARERIVAIDAGIAPATPDSRPNAERILRLAEEELSLRGAKP